MANTNKWKIIRCNDLNVYWGPSTLTKPLGPNKDSEDCDGMILVEWDTGDLYVYDSANHIWVVFGSGN